MSNVVETINYLDWNQSIDILKVLRGRDEPGLSSGALVHAAPEQIRGVRDVAFRL